MWVFGVRLPADSDTPGGGDATIESEGLAGWTEDFDRALATARTSVPVSQATLVAYKVRWVVSGVLLADDAVLTEIDEALQVAEQSSDRQRDSRCWPNSAACALSSVTRWMRFPCGLRARGCPPDEAMAYAQHRRGERKRPAVAGRRSRPSSATSYDRSAKRSPTTTSRQGFSSHPAPCKPTSLMCTQSSG